MRDYSLPQHVYISSDGDALVFLDLRQDKYTMLIGAQAAAFKAFFLDASNLALTSSAQAKSAVAASPRLLPDMLRELLSAGLLMEGAIDGKAVALTDTDVATKQLSGLDSTAAMATVTPRHIADFLVSCVVATLKLRFQSIESTVRSVQRRKARHAYSSAWRDADAQRLSVVFGRLRSFFPANYLCLFDSLALVEFLARYRVYPTWVFAIQTQPWRAHCWVQDGECALNEDVELAESFAPIMTV